MLPRVEIERGTADRGPVSELQGGVDDRKVRADLLSDNAGTRSHRPPSPAFLDRRRDEIVEQATNRNASQGKYATCDRCAQVKDCWSGSRQHIFPLRPDARP